MNADPPESIPSKPTWWPSGRPDGRLSAAGSSPRAASSSAGSRARRSSDSTWPTARKSSFPGGHDSWVFSLAFSPDGETTLQRRRRRPGRRLGDRGRRTQARPDDRSPPRLGPRHGRRAPTASSSPPAATTGSSGSGMPSTGQLVRELTGHARPCLLAGIPSRAASRC